MAKDPELSAHVEWLGYIQPVGLVVSPPALVQAQAHINRNVIPQHQRFIGCLPVNKDDEPLPLIDDLPKLVREVLDWQDTDLIHFDDAIRAGRDVNGLEVVLPEYNETLRPTWIVPEFQSQNAAHSEHVAATVAEQPAAPARGLFDSDSSELDQETPADVPLTVEEPKSGYNASRYVMLIQQVQASQDLDEPLEESDRRWHASPHARFERLLRETQIPAGLLTNGRNLRLVYAPRGETSGYLTFNVQEMMTVAGRPIFAAFHMLLNSDRLFNLEKKQRLPNILVESRKYQNTVSTQLAQQVMAALYEFLRGFQAADDQWNGRLLKDVLVKDPQHVYHGLLTVLMRTVFVLYAEDRNLLSNHPVYTNYYSITGLFERLRSDAGQYPDTMDQRYGAWAQLLTLFRMIYEGGSHAELQIPPRKGYLFDPNRYPFLEGRYDDGDKQTSSRQEQDTAVHVPRVSDGVVYRVLNNLLMLDGERLSYRSLDVEQIGSVYEAIMGFEVEVSTGRSIAIKPAKKHGAPATINLEELLSADDSKRAAWLKERTDLDFSGKASEALKAAKTIEELLAALESKIANEVTPNVVPAGAMIFQPSDERRRSGSHYTPRSLTEPIVRTTLEPILKQLVTPFSTDSGEKVADRPDEGATAVPTEPQPWAPTAADKKRYTAAEIETRIRQSERAIEHARAARKVGVLHPSQILDLKVCDPAMGSGAFLVETCRQLGDELIKSWYAHDLVPKDIPADEDEVLYARRQIAQRCLYGVDKNIMAVDLAKLSLWLVTLAKAHPFTFLDHSLRYGDSLVGLTRQQIIGFHWEPSKQKKFGEDLIQKRLDRATEARAKILNAREDVAYRDQESRLAQADEALNVVRLTGDACVSAFFAGSKKKEREDRCEDLFTDVTQHYQNIKDGKLDMDVRGRIAAAAESLRSGEHPLPPFHWEIEFPEVFSRENGGFDAFVGNPPFMAKNTIASALHRHFGDYLLEAFPESNGKSDIVSFFFRQAFQRLRKNGCLGLIATKTIAQGDTRSAGLTFIATHGGTIFSARKRFPWPGVAAVSVSVVYICRGKPNVVKRLDGRIVTRISAFLFPNGADTDPLQQHSNLSRGFQGCNISGQGFLFDDEDDRATPTSVMRELIDKHPNYRLKIRPFLGGTEINSRSDVSSDRFVIGFGRMPLEEAETGWPKLVDILRQKVKPDREGRPKNKQSIALAKRWWQWHTDRPTFQAASEGMSQVIVASSVTAHFCFVFQHTSRVFAHTLNVFALDTYSAFAAMQSRPHEIWVRFFASSLEDRLRYTITDSFETYPFPTDWRSHDDLEQAGRVYHSTRQDLMLKQACGLTDVYNRFHDPHEQSSEILHLRDLHAEMDRAVLEAYGWHDLAQTARCEFLLDYEDDDDSGDESQESGSGKRQKKKPWRLRWPDEFRDEVLARLLELNEQRHKEELLAGKAITTKRSTDDDDESDSNTDEEADSPKPKKTATESPPKPRAPRKSKKSPATGQQEMDF
jgi:hypothetical protein